MGMSVHHQWFRVDRRCRQVISVQKFIREGDFSLRCGARDPEWERDGNPSSGRKKTPARQTPGSQGATTDKGEIVSLSLGALADRGGSTCSTAQAPGEPGDQHQSQT